MSAEPINDQPITLGELIDALSCEWYEQENGSVVTSCGARLKDHALYKKCPKCKAGRIRFVNFQDDTEYDDGDYDDDE